MTAFTAAVWLMTLLRPVGMPDRLLTWCRLRKNFVATESAYKRDAGFMQRVSSVAMPLLIAEAGDEAVGQENAYEPAAG